jgi:hypothetical protein
MSENVQAENATTNPVSNPNYNDDGEKPAALSSINAARPVFEGRH